MIHKSFGSTSKEITNREKTNAALSRKLAAEGIVLLKNDGGLPLQNKDIALFGNGARMTSKGGTGSGDVYTRYVVSIEEGLKNAGFNIETSLYLDDFDKYYQQQYNNWKTDRQNILKDISEVMEIVNAALEVPFRFPTAIPIVSSHLDEVSSSTAIYILTRQAGEGHDRKLIQGDYYLTDLEESNIEKISDRFDNVIIIINTGSVIDTSFIEKYSSIKSVLFIGQTGMEVGNAVADILSGNQTPSGKLTSSWAKKYEDYPNAMTYSHINGNTEEEIYHEDIYIGYRYFDTFGISVAFPFGHGLSYTKFTIETSNISLNDFVLTMDISTTNIGSYQGKEIVQVYISLPESDIHHEYQRLIGFHKTKSLNPSEKEEFIINIPVLDTCTVYDEKTASYHLIKGEYRVRLGDSSDNTKLVCTIHVDEDIVVEQCQNACIARVEFDRLSKRPQYDDISQNVQVLRLSGDNGIIKHKYNSLTESHSNDLIEKTIDRMTIEDLATLVVGAGNRAETMIQIPTSTSTTCLLHEKYGIPGIHLTDGPAGLKINPENVEQPDGTLKPLNVPTGKGNFMDLLDTSMFIGHEDDGQAHYFYATAWPVATVLAQTWNVEILEEMGQAVAIEMQEFGTSIWLAPGMNIHRNPLCGRNFEYYSEDPYLSGILGSAITKGVQSNPSLGVSLKHFAANNQEDNRQRSNSNVSERALREIYLKGFEMVVKNQNPKTIMSSYNKLNGSYTPNSHDLLTKILRDEWGFKGMVMTDWGSCEGDKGSPSKAIAAGNDLIMPGTPENIKDIVSAIESETLSIEQLKVCARRVLNLIAMNNYIPFE